MARAGGVVGIDLNADHLAAGRVEVAGNPVGRPLRVPLDLAGASTTTRDGRLRAAITAVLEHARTTGATAVAVEDLDFTDSKSRELFGRRRAFRHTIAGFPTTQFKDRIVAMAATQGLAVIAVDPRYTSRYGGASWQRALTTATVLATRHEGAAVAIGRRALGHGLTTRAGKPAAQAASAARPPPARWKHGRQRPGTGNHRHGRGPHPGRRPPATRSRTTALPAPTPIIGCGHAWRAIGAGGCRA